MEIITDLNILKTVCNENTNREYCEEIAKKLFSTISDGNSGIGLASNQLGITDCRVAVVNVKSPLYFINPKITLHEESGKFVFLETCLSIPKVIVRTERYRKITVSADNLSSPVTYSVENVSQDKIMNSINALEICAIQHELDHLNGITMLDRQYIPVPFSVKGSPKRNDKILVKKGDIKKLISFKKLDTYISNGWVKA